MLASLRNRVLHFKIYGQIDAKMFVWLFNNIGQKKCIKHSKEKDYWIFRWLEFQSIQEEVFI